MPRGYYGFLGLGGVDRDYGGYSLGGLGGYFDYGYLDDRVDYGVRLSCSFRSQDCPLSCSVVLAVCRVSTASQRLPSAARRLQREVVPSRIMHGCRAPLSPDSRSQP